MAVTLLMHISLLRGETLNYRSGIVAKDGIMDGILSYAVFQHFVPLVLRNIWGWPFEC